ncbi:MAG: M64 family metallopeptidase [Pyrinomonadaceae bacterium]
MSFQVIFVTVVCFLTLSIAVRAEPFDTIRNNGDPINRVDIAVLGDGYTASEIGQYRLDVHNFMQGVFAQEPYQEYQRYFNVHRVDIVSSQSGADHPERSPQHFVDTALDANYNCGSIQRLICVSTTKVNQAIARSLPSSHFDIILVMVNDSEYGGSGGSVAVASINPSAVELILHEVGHSFGLLADEYTEENSHCNPNIEPPAVNSTIETDRNMIEWRHWIDGGTPIPTSTNQPALPGLYQGSSYCNLGFYRPTYNSKMRALGPSFEQINIEQHIRRIYTFISPLDESSPAGPSVLINSNEIQPFTVSVPVPFTHSLTVNWQVDGQPVGQGLAISLDSSAYAVGSHNVRAIITDTTPFVRHDPSQLLSETRDWSVTIQAASVESPFDFDGDGRTDIGITRVAGSMEWWINRSSVPMAFATSFGVPTDVPSPADFTGDGKTDIAVWRPSTGFWYVLRSEDLTFFAFPFGADGDLPVPADYDGDGKADPTVFRPSTNIWYQLLSSGGSLSIQFGAAGDKPIPSDYDGDGKADIAIFRKAGASGGEWWILRSTDGLFAAAFGNSTDMAVPGDYTGDGKTDLAMWRPSNGYWYILRSEDLSFFGFPWGQNGDVPAAGDYDGDGTWDAAIFRPTVATWFINQSTAGTLITTFGANADRPIPNAYVP